MMRFTEFVERVLRLTLTRGQRILSRVVFDGLEPAQLEGEDRELARQLFGDVDVIPPSARRILVLVLGRGSGKTTLVSAYGLYVAVTADVSRCGPGDVPVVVVIAPDRKTASLSVRMALEMVRATPDLARMLESETSDGFTLRRHDGRLVSFEAFAASRGGSSARGRSILAFILDEAQFFRSDDGGAFVVNDRDVYRALIPRLLKGGKGIFISTPWPTDTLMGELFAKNHEAPSTALAARAPTLLMRDDDPDLEATIEAERARDAENALREFDCDTSLTGAGSYFDAGAIDAAVDDAALAGTRVAHFEYAAGADFAFKSDSSALVVTQYDGKTYSVVALEELRPQRGKPLQPSAVVETFAAVAKGYGVNHLIADAHYREAIHEALLKHRMYIVDAPAGISGKTETYARARAVLHDGRARLPNHPRFLAQLKAIVSKPTPGGGVSIVSPRRAGGGHGDIVSAWVLAVHGLTYARPRAQEDTYVEDGLLKRRNVDGSVTVLRDVRKRDPETQAMLNAALKRWRSSGFFDRRRSM